MRAREFILESVDPYTIFNQVKDIHREFQDIEEGDLPDRIYWFDDYELTQLPLSKINLDEFYIDEDLIEEYIEHIKDSPNTMPPIVYDPIAGSVIDGMHRANAYARLGRSSIPAYVGKTKSDSYGERESDGDEDLQESEITDIGSQIQNSLGLKSFVLHDRGNDIVLDSLIVGKENQGQGLGTKAMQMLTQYADQNGKRIILTPGLQDKTHGTTSRSRLVKFYKQFGFKESKGRYIDYAIGAGKMYREPKNS